MTKLTAEQIAANEKYAAETERLKDLTPRPKGLTPGTMEYQEHFRKGSTSLSIPKKSK